ncbi:hypothetical protein GUITHDRAFT_100679 [Guillardia theta CCMP2712]|uniref:Uncharacterized protein n=1 Tax=Guillardia theta (strain CCMP2712) TaxID=905079 RepID=L1JZS3_GUITC|nr:hypothetical protein GUITHDRAFT_100679 [Guillardia theta CCMP2712]EKX53705.1 hypothetical protein GUITHDRAFT_100679 [Guillardia theta CCMP2712]|eukprot:XP_005840685.1 hypothetical protein GUITHDRAFT_100679 [Guillardia theta CCMP2712]
MAAMPYVDDNSGYTQEEEDGLAVSSWNVHQGYWIVEPLSHRDEEAAGNLDGDESALMHNFTQNSLVSVLISDGVAIAAWSMLAGSLRQSHTFTVRLSTLLVCAGVSSSLQMYDRSKKSSSATEATGSSGEEVAAASSEAGAVDLGCHSARLRRWLVVINAAVLGLRTSLMMEERDPWFSSLPVKSKCLSSFGLSCSVLPCVEDGSMLPLPLIALSFLAGCAMLTKRKLDVSLFTSLACSLRLSAILGLHAIDLLRKSRCSSLRVWCPGLRGGGDRKVRMWDLHRSILRRASLLDEMMWQQVNDFTRIMHFLTQSPKEALLYGGAKILTNALLTWWGEVGGELAVGT